MQATAHFCLKFNSNECTAHLPPKFKSNGIHTYRSLCYVLYAQVQSNGIHTTHFCLKDSIKWNVYTAHVTSSIKWNTYSSLLSKVSDGLRFNQMECIQSKSSIKWNAYSSFLSKVQSNGIHTADFCLKFNQMNAGMAHFCLKS
ncbi:unnamed protein product [Mytilus edulis]|uniref:Uncharacterized protein n=1 Tax=Mytilus edulis TaxID=6550 RepID=A0A8S3VN17_MYTED|nr:unnamed protein product [Mytilus edulis]